MTRQPQSADDPLWDEEPTRTARTGQGRPFEPSMEDRAAAAAMSAAGLFRPASMLPGCTPGAGFRKRRGAWGRAMETWKDAGDPEVPPK